VVLHAKNVRADALPTMRKAIAVANQVTLFQNHQVITIRTSHTHTQWVVADELESFGLGLVAMRLSDQAMQMGLHHEHVSEPPAVAAFSNSLLTFPGMGRGQNV
jgi:hypothetical protein